MLKEGGGRTGSGFAPPAGARGHGGERGRARAGAAGRLGAAHPHRGRVAARRPRVRRRAHGDACACRSPSRASTPRRRSSDWCATERSSCARSRASSRRAATCCVPLLGGYGLPFLIVGRPAPADGPFHGGGAWTTISPGYFEVFKIAVVRGRTLTERDDAHAPPVTWINETMARQFFPDADPIGQRLVIGRGISREFADEPEREIVGVVADTRAYLAMEPQPSMFIPQAQVLDAVNALNVGITPLAWVVRTRTDPGPMVPAIQEELRKATGLPVTDAQVMTEVRPLGHLAPALQHVADDGVRGRRAVARRDRDLRPARLLGRAAHARDRRPGRDRRRRVAGPAHGGARGDAASRSSVSRSASPPRSRWRARSRASSTASRPGIRSSSPLMPVVLALGRAGRGVAAGEAGEPGRSDRGATVRVERSRQSDHEQALRA